MTADRAADDSSNIAPTDSSCQADWFDRGVPLLIEAGIECRLRGTKWFCTAALGYETIIGETIGRSGSVTPEIRAFEFAMGIFGVLIGLAIADIATSFHRLLRRKSTVKWDPLALLAALYALCMAIYMWFDLWGVRNFAGTRHFFFYLFLFAQLFVLFLVAAASLPDEVDTTTDLREFYAANRRNFWFLVVLFQIGYVAAGFYFAGGEPSLPNWVVALEFAQMFAPLVLALILLATKSRAAHYAVVGLLFVTMLIHYGRASIN